MPPKRKAPAALTKEGNDGTSEVKKRGRSKAAASSEPEHEEAGEAPASPVPLRKSGRKPEDVVAEKAIPKGKPAPKVKAAASKAKPAPKVKPDAEEKPSAKEKASPKAKMVPKVKAPAKKKAAPAVKGDKEEMEVEGSEDEGQEEEAKPKKPLARKAIDKMESAEGFGEDSENDVKFAEVSNGLKKSVIIEHCKQCNAFKTRALHVQQYLQKAVSGLEVVINPEKPRRGCFEIRDGEGNIYVSLLGMPRPFAKLKALDMDETAANIVEQLK